ncbi:MAG: hypothetical protein KGR18_00255 [Acidobacteria bacterium]|nr:hypothetical protein [Acidobacteriota bacterium]
MERTPGRGRPRQFCRDGCRQQAYLARRLAAAHGLGDDELVVAREALEELQSRLYCLQAALEDISRDLARSSEPEDVAEALAWLRENAEPVASMWIEPRTGERSTAGASSDPSDRAEPAGSEPAGSGPAGSGPAGSDA